MMRACAFIALFMAAGCGTQAVTPAPRVDATLRGPAGETAAVTSALSSGNGSLLIVSLEGADPAKEWAISIRSGTCEAPGPIVAAGGVIDHGATMQSVVDVAFGDLPGMIVVIVPLTSDTIASCGVFELAAEP
jgi:hypothetical protein